MDRVIGRPQAPSLTSETTAKNSADIQDAAHRLISHELRWRVHRPPPESLPFGETLLENPDIRIVVERIVPTCESTLPFFWVWGSEPELFMNAAEDESEVANTRLMVELENAVLFRAEWVPTADIISGLEQLDVTIIESEGTSERWLFEVRAEEREQLMRFLEVFQDQDIAISLDRLYDLSEVVEQDRRALTQKQRDTLLTAFREGYFEKPREVTQEELAAEFGISSRAVSERLRRANRNLIENTLLLAGDPL